MPCACQLPPEMYPDASEWGPLLWSILHGIAARAGRALFPMYQMDERRALVRFMEALGKMIPCPSCKEHYDVYLKEHPVAKTLMEMPYSAIGLYVQTWFWELHNWVNESHKKPLYPFEDLAAAYGSTPVRQKLREFDVPMTRAIRVRSGQLMGYKEFMKHALTLLSIYGM